MGFLRAAASRVTSTVSRATSSVSRNVSRAASNATRNVSRAASSFTQSARRTASNATRSAQRTLSSVSRNVSRAASSASRNVSRAFSSASRNVSRAASSASRNVSRSFAGAQRRVGSTLSSATSAVRRTASSAVRNTQRTFSSVTRSAQRTASTFTRNVSRSFSGAQRQVGGTLSRVTSGVTRRATSLGNNVSRTLSSTVRGTQRTFSSAVRSTQRTFSSVSRNINQSLTTTRRNISQAARNTLSTTSRLGQQTLSAARSTGRNMLNGYHNLIEQSYQDARALQRSNNPFERAVGNYSVGVRNGIARLNRTVDSSIEYWRGVGGPVGRVGETLASLGKGFTAPLRAVDHTATRQQRNGALIETGISLATAGAGRLAGPALRGLSRTPVGRATVRQLTRLGNTRLGRGALNQFSRLSRTATRVNTAPARALSRSRAGQALLRTEANVRRQLSRANHFGNSQAARGTSGRGYYQIRERKTSVPNAERLTGPASARQPQTSSYCGHACVSNVNRTNGGRNVSMWDLTRTNPPGPDGLDIHEVAGMLNGLGHRARPVQSQNILQFGRAIQDSGSPAILLRNGHFITIDAVENGMVYFRDPLAGSYRAPITSFSDKYHGVLVDR